MNKEFFQDIEKKTAIYYDSYRRLFLSSKPKANFYRSLSAAFQVLLFKGLEINLLPIIPLFIWLFGKIINIQIPLFPINVPEFYFLSIWINCVLWFSFFWIAFILITWLFYNKYRKKILPRIAYPFCLISEAYLELSSYIVNKNEHQLENSMNLLYEYIYVERRNNLILMRPLADGSVSIGTSRRIYSTILNVVSELHWLEITEKSKAIAKALDDFDTHIIDAIESKESLEQIKEAIKYLQIYEYLSLTQEEHQQDNLKIHLNDLLLMFSGIIESINLKRFEEIIIDDAIEVQKEKRLLPSIFSKMVEERKIITELVKWFFI